MPDIVPLFPTPLFVFPPLADDGLPAEIARIVLAESARAPGITVANAGDGWHSVPDLALRQDPPWQRLIRRLVDQVSEVAAQVAPAVRAPGFGVQAWAMVLRDGGWVVPHAHGDADWSVAWYADAGGEPGVPDAGSLAFLDPRPGMPSWAPPTFTVRPQTGMTVVFPGFLSHFVHPWRGGRPRVAISANLSVGGI